MKCGSRLREMKAISRCIRVALLRIMEIETT